MYKRVLLSAIVAVSLAVFTASVSAQYDDAFANPEEGTPTIAPPTTAATPAIPAQPAAVPAPQTGTAPHMMSYNMGVYPPCCPPPINCRPAVCCRPVSPCSGYGCGGYGYGYGYGYGCNYPPRYAYPTRYHRAIYARPAYYGGAGCCW